MKPTALFAVVPQLFLLAFRLARCCNALLSKTDAHPMKAFRSFISIVGIVVCICGCATSGTDRVVQIGLNTYKMAGVGKSTDLAGSAVKARLYQQAAEFCRSKGGQMIPLNSTAQDSKPGQYASAEIRFKCVPASR